MGFRRSCPAGWSAAEANAPVAGTAERSAPASPGSARRPRASRQADARAIIYVDPTSMPPVADVSGANRSGSWRTSCIRRCRIPPEAPDGRNRTIHIATRPPESASRPRRPVAIVAAGPHLVCPSWSSHAAHRAPDSRRKEQAAVSAWPELPDLLVRSSCRVNLVAELLPIRRPPPRTSGGKPDTCLKSVNGTCCRWSPRLGVHRGMTTGKIDDRFGGRGDGALVGVRRGAARPGRLPLAGSRWSADAAAPLVGIWSDGHFAFCTEVVVEAHVNLQHSPLVAVTTSGAGNPAPASWSRGTAQRVTGRERLRPLAEAMATQVRQ